MRGQNLACLGRRHLELGNDGNSLDLLAPRELDMVADAVRWLRGSLSGIHTSCRRREDLSQRNFDSGDVLRGKRLQVCPNEASEEGSADVVRMAL